MILGKAKNPTSDELLTSITKFYNKQMIPFLVLDLQFVYKTFGFKVFNIEEFLNQTYLFKFKNVFKSICTIIIAKRYAAAKNICHVLTVFNDLLGSIRTEISLYPDIKRKEANDIINRKKDQIYDCFEKLFATNKIKLD